MEVNKLKTNQISFIVVVILFLVIPITFLFYKKSKKNPNDEVLSGFVLSKSIKPTHIIDLPDKKGMLTVRSIPLSAAEFKMANSGSSIGEIVNKKTIIAYVDHGKPVELIGEEGNCFKIKTETYKGVVAGFIAKSYMKKNTLTGLYKKY